MKSPYDKIAKIYTNNFGHMTEMIAMPINNNNKKPSKSSFPEPEGGDLGTWYITFDMSSIPSMLKDIIFHNINLLHHSYIPNKKRNTPLRTVQLCGRSQVIGRFSLYQFRGMSCIVASHVFCNLASKLC